MTSGGSRSTTALGGHLRSLDGLRGLAALVVLVRHSSNAVTMPLEQRRMLLEGPFSLLFNAQGAVQLFFVLSGYVLASSLNRNRYAIDWPQFYVKRVFRIYPPYIFAVCLAFLLSRVHAPIRFDAIDGLTPWLARSTHLRVSGEQLVQSFGFPGQAYGLLDVGWTLSIEMVFSLLLPLMFLFARRFHWSALLVVSVAILIYGSGGVTYSLHFTLGIIAFFERERLGIWISALPAALRGLVVFAGLLLLCAPSLLGWTTQQMGILVVGHSPGALALVGSGSFVVLVSSLFVPSVSRVLGSAIVAYFGKISFSIYLIHLTMVNLLAPMVVTSPSRWTDVALLLFCVAGSTLLLSAGAYRWVERPSILVGNWICGQLARRVGTRSVRSELIDPA